MLTNELLFCRKQCNLLICLTLYLYVTRYLILYNDHQIKLP